MSFWTNKVVWITGASSGIGAELARQLSKKEASLILTSRNEEKLAALKSELVSAEIIVLPADLSNYKEADALAAEAIQQFGHIDVLINNAGITQRATADQTQIEVDERLMAINYFAPVALTKAMVPHFIEGGGGYIAVTSSVAGKLGTPQRSAYCASKFALHGFYESLRAEMYDQGIRVTIVCPGFIATDISMNALKGDGSAYARMDDAVASGLSVEDCASQYIRAIELEKEEVVISGSREKIGVWLARFLPNLLRRRMRKASVT